MQAIKNYAAAAASVGAVPKGGPLFFCQNDGFKFLTIHYKLQTQKGTIARRLQPSREVPFSL
jgi:hypothetical protein